MAGIRRTWDKELYEAKAKGLGARDEDDEKPTKPSSSKEEFKRAGDGSEGPVGSERAFLKAREGRIDLESKAGTIEVIKPNTVEHAAGPGWYCEVCSCLLKDSTSYLDHINGKRHQRTLGFSMRVERANVDQVKDRLELLKRKISNKDNVRVPSASEEYESKLALQVAEEERLKRQRKEDLLTRQKERHAAELEDADPDIAALMGFGSFTKKK